MQSLCQYGTLTVILYQKDRVTKEHCPTEKYKDDVYKQLQSQSHFYQDEGNNTNIVLILSVRQKVRKEE